MDLSDIAIKLYCTEDQTLFASASTSEMPDRYDAVVHLQSQADLLPLDLGDLIDSEAEEKGTYDSLNAMTFDKKNPLQEEHFEKNLVGVSLYQKDGAAYAILHTKRQLQRETPDSERGYVGAIAVGKSKNPSSLVAGFQESEAKLRLTYGVIELIRDSQEKTSENLEGGLEALAGKNEIYSLAIPPKEVIDWGGLMPLDEQLAARAPTAEESPREIAASSEDQQRYSGLTHDLDIPLETEGESTIRFPGADPNEMNWTDTELVRYDSNQWNDD